MPTHTTSDPALHDVIRAIGYRAAQAGARGVAISRLRSGTWMVVLTPQTSAAATTHLDARTLTTKDIVELVAEARARRGRSSDIVNGDQLALGSIVRTGGEALERAGQDTFLLMADQNGLVGMNSEGDLPPVHISPEQVALKEGWHRTARESGANGVRQGQRVWYRPRGAHESTPVVIERSGARKVAIRLPSGEKVRVRRKWLLGAEPTIAAEGADVPPDTSVAPQSRESPSMHIEALTASLVYSLGLDDSNVDLRERIRDLVTWLFDADSDQSAATVAASTADSMQRQSLRHLLTSTSSPSTVERELLRLRPELHHLARAGFPPEVQPAIESISAMDHRLDMLLTWAIDEPFGGQAGHLERETAGIGPLVRDPFTVALDSELSILRELVTHLEAAGDARRRLFRQQPDPSKS